MAKVKLKPVFNRRGLGRPASASGQYSLTNVIEQLECRRMFSEMIFNDTYSAKSGVTNLQGSFNTPNADENFQKTLQTVLDNAAESTDDIAEKFGSKFVASQGFALDLTRSMVNLTALADDASTGQGWAVYLGDGYKIMGAGYSAFADGLNLYGLPETGVVVGGFGKFFNAEGEFMTNDGQRQADIDYSVVNGSMGTFIDRTQAAYQSAYASLQALGSAPASAVATDEVAAQANLQSFVDSLTPLYQASGAAPVTVTIDLSGNSYAVSASGGLGSSSTGTGSISVQDDGSLSSSTFATTSGFSRSEALTQTSTGPMDSITESGPQGQGLLNETTSASSSGIAISVSGPGGPTAEIAAGDATVNIATGTTATVDGPGNDVSAAPNANVTLDGIADSFTGTSGDSLTVSTSVPPGGGTSVSDTLNVSSGTVAVTGTAQAVVIGDDDQVTADSTALCTAQGTDDTLDCPGQAPVTTDSTDSVAMAYQGQDSVGANLAAKFGSEIGGLLGGNNQFTKIVGSTVGGALGKAVAAIANDGYSLLSDSQSTGSGVSYLDQTTSQVLSYLGEGKLEAKLEQKGVSALSSLIVSEAAQQLGLTGFAGTVFTTEGGQITTALLKNIVTIVSNNGVFDTDSLFAGINSISLISSLGTLGASWLTNELNGLVPVPADLGQSLLESLGGEAGSAALADSINAYLASTVFADALCDETLSAITSLLLPGIGVVIGTLVGEFAGSAVYTLLHDIGGGLFNEIFGDDKWEYRDLDFNPATNHLEAPYSLDSAKNTTADLRQGTGDLTDSYLSVVNGIIDAVGGQVDTTSVDAHDLASEPAFYAYVSDNKWWGENDYQVVLGDENNGHVDEAHNPQNIIDIGAEYTLSKIKFLNGDPVVLAAFNSWQASLTNPESGADLGSLESDIQTAQEYSRYLHASAPVNALLASNADTPFATGWIATLLQAQSLQLSSGAADILVNRANAELAAGDQVDGVYNLNYSLEFDSTNPAVWSELGNSQIASGNISGGIYSLQQSVQLDPTNSAVWAALGNAQVINGDLPDAIYSLQQSEGIDPTKAVVWSDLGNAQAAYATELSSQGDATDAATYFAAGIYSMQRSIGVDATVAPVWASLGSAQVGYSALLVGQNDVTDGIAQLTGGIYSLERSIGIDATSAPAWAELGNAQITYSGILTQQNDPTDAATNLNGGIYSLERSVGLNASNSAAWVALGRAQLSAGDTAGAMSSLANAQQLGAVLQPSWFPVASMADIANSISNSQLPNGAIEISQAPAGYDQNNVPYYKVDPYFANQAIQGLLSVPAVGNASPLTVAQNYFNWYLSSVSNTGTIDDYYFYANGTQAIAPSLPDSDDSYAATFLSAVWQYYKAGGSMAFFLASGMKAKLAEIAGIPLSLQQPATGLTVTYTPQNLPPLTSETSYTEDNSEVFAGFTAMANIESSVYGDPVSSQTYATAAARVKAGIMTDLYNSSTGLFDVAVGVPANPTGSWYPGATPLAWPVLEGVVAAGSPIAQAQMSAIDSIWNGVYEQNWTTRSDSASIGLVALMTGESQLVTADLSTLARDSFPSIILSPDQPGVDVGVTTVADAGFLLRMFAPAAEDVSVVTASATPVDINVTSVDYDISTASSALTVSIVGSPASGSAAVLPGGNILYTPAAGFDGRAVFTYQIVDSKGFGSTAQVVVVVAPPSTVNVVYWTGFGDGSTWSDAGNWSGGLAPTSQTNVLIGTGFTPMFVPAGTFTVNTMSESSPLEIATGGQLVIEGSSTFADGLSIDAGARLNIATTPSSSNPGPLVVNGLDILSGGTLDIGRSAVVVQNGSMPQIISEIAGGYAGGVWNGSGIISSAAQSDPTHLTAIGVILNNSGQSTPIYGGNTGRPFDGFSPSLNDVLIKYTYYGDADLNGSIDGSDYSRIDNGDFAHLTGWYNGDLNYDGTIDGSDYTLIDNGFNRQGANLAAIVATPATEVVASHNANFVSSTADIPKSFDLAPGKISLAQTSEALLADEAFNHAAFVGTGSEIGSPMIDNHPLLRFGSKRWRKSQVPSMDSALSIGQRSPFSTSPITLWQRHRYNAGQ